MLSIPLAPASLVPFGQEWQAPSREDVRAVLAAAGMGSADGARYVGVSRNELNKWTTGAESIPFSCWALLCWKAGAGAFWDPRPAA